jgi:hypothetical protein
MPERYTIEDHGERTHVLGYYVIDNETEGGKRLCHHSSLERAQAEIRRLTSGGAVDGSPLPPTSTEMLRKPAGAIRHAVSTMMDRGLLEDMHQRETQGKARSVVLAAIEARLADL